MVRTGKQDKRIMKFMADIAKTVGLEGWTLALGVFQPEGADEQMPWAQVDVVPYRRLATVTLHPEFLMAGHKNILHVLVHECLHLYFADIRQALRDLHEYHVLAEQPHSLLTMQMHNYEELSVDKMAEAWSAIMWEWEAVQRALRGITKQVERSI